MKTKTAVLSLMLAAASFSAQAGHFVNGNQLLDLMNRSEIHYNMEAIGFVKGVADATAGTRHCTPDAIPAGQVLDMTKKMLEAYPEARHVPAGRFVTTALANVWPCKSAL